MNIIEAHALLIELEKKFPVDQWMINDVHIWPMIRIDLWMNLYYASYKKETSGINFFFKIRQGLKIFVNTKNFFFSTVKDYKKNVKISSSDVVFLTDTDDRTYLHNYWYDRGCDPLVTYFKNQNVQSLVLEKSQQYLTPRYFPSVYIQPALDFVVVKNLFFTKRKLTLFLPEYDSFINVLTEKKLSIPLPTRKRITTVFRVLDSYTTCFTKLLQKVNPKLCFVVCYYSPVGLALNVACRKLGIPSVDIQHGVQGEYQPAYGGWHKLPKKGYEMLPEIFACWSETEIATIKKWNKNVTKWHKPLLLGNMWIDFWKNKFGQSQDTIHILRKTKNNSNILVTLSYIDEQNSILLKKLQKIASQDTTITWWIRMHPSVLKNKEHVRKMIEESGIIHYELDKASEYPLYSLLEHMDMHITHASAVVFEAEAFGILSIVTNEEESNHFPNQLLSGVVQVAITADAIKKKIDEIRNMKRKSNDKEKARKVEINRSLAYLLARAKK